MALTEQQQHFGYRFGLVSGMASILGFAYLVYHLAETRKKGAADDEVDGVAGLGALPTKGRIPIAVAKRALQRFPPRVQACGITPELLREGMEVEREHRDVTRGTVDRTARIAAAHLCERRDYYKLLKKYVEG